jgi:hypothetical protein
VDCGPHRDKAIPSAQVLSEETSQASCVKIVLRAALFNIAPADMADNDLRSVSDWDAQSKSAVRILGVFRPSQTRILVEGTDPGQYGGGCTHVPARHRVVLEAGSSVRRRIQGGRDGYDMVRTFWLDATRDDPIRRLSKPSEHHLGPTCLHQAVVVRHGDEPSLHALEASVECGCFSAPTCPNVLHIHAEGSKQFYRGKESRVILALVNQNQAGGPCVS